VLTVLGGLAEFERDLIRARTSEGWARAVARDVKLGRKPKLTDHQKRKAIRRRDLDGETVRDIRCELIRQIKRAGFPQIQQQARVRFDHLYHRVNFW
jgi:DNA invertase Pin-like site-specific DNA recombinase